MSRLPIIGAKESDSKSACSHGAHVAPVADEASVLGDRGFAGNVALVTLGCAKNLVDSEVMLGALQQRGFRPIQDASLADLIVVNTCAFLQSAVEEGVDTILDLARYKKEGRCRKLIVAGCMVERYRAQLVETLPEVDRFISTDELLTVADDGSTTEECIGNARRPYFLYDESMPRLRSTSGHTAFLKIAEGCNRPCAFCIIPKIRGTMRSRPISSVVAEARNLVTDGVKELNLVAQDLTAYGADFEGNRGIKSALPELLRQLGGVREIRDDFWVRLLYAYPIGVNEELIDLIMSTPYICKYLDIPLQHVSHSVLKSMRRPLGEKGTRALVEKMRSMAPDLAIRTTFIVGFPGETEEDVEALRAFIAEGHFAHVGVFPYSQEEEADSYTFENQIPEEVREERRQIVMEAQQENVSARLKSFVGKEIRALVDGLHEESDMFLTARADWQGPETDGGIIINDAAEEFVDSERGIVEERVYGKFVRVEITDVAGYDLVGRIVGVEQ